MTKTEKHKNKYRVWTGSSYEYTMAVSEAKAISNVQYIMRCRGKFPVMRYFTAERVNG